jgi:hypothetical protein
MSVVVNFTSAANPPNNINSFNIERAVRPASGSIAVVGDVNNITKVITVTFGTPPADDALRGDQMHIGGVLYNIIANSSTTITFTPTTDLSTITVFPAAFDVINDLAHFGNFELVGASTPSIPFIASTVHQFTDSTGTIFDFYRIKSVDSGGTVSSEPLSTPFRVGQVISLSIDESRKDPKDSLHGVIGGSMAFEVTVMSGGRRQDPKDNVVYADVFVPSYLAPNGQFSRIETVQLVRVGQAKYRGTWTIPSKAPSAVGGFDLFPSDEYVVRYKANFLGLLEAAPDDLQEFDSELFSLTTIDGPIAGNFPPYATVEDLRLTFFEIDAYLPESIPKADVEQRNAVLQRHLQWASDKLREELNLSQLRAMSSDRNEYVVTRASYTLLMASRGQNSSAISDKLLDQWKDRAEYILAQLKREGVAQGIPLGRG